MLHDPGDSGDDEDTDDDNWVSGKGKPAGFRRNRRRSRGTGRVRMISPLQYLDSAIQKKERIIQGKENEG